MKRSVTLFAIERSRTRFASFTQNRVPVRWNGDRADLSRPSRLSGVRHKLSSAAQLGPVHSNFGKFFAYAMAAHGFMFVTMGIASATFLSSFVHSGTTGVTLWLAKDILPAIISVVTISLAVPEQNTKMWFALGYACSNVVYVMEFLVPLFVSGPLILPLVGSVSSLAKSLTMLILSISRATILEQYALGNNFGTLTRAYTNCSVMAYAVFYAAGLAISYLGSWPVQACAITASASMSIVCSVAAVRDFVPRKVTLALVVFCVQRRSQPSVVTPEVFACIGGVEAKHRGPASSLTPAACRAYVGDVQVIVNPDLGSLASSVEEFEQTAHYCAKLKTWLFVQRRPPNCDVVYVLYSTAVTMSEALAVMFLVVQTIESVSSGCTGTSASLSELLGVAAKDAALQDAALQRGRALETDLVVAGWQVLGSGFDDYSMRIARSPSCDVVVPPHTQQE